MQTIQLTIPSMKSPHCMMVVKGAVRTIEGAVLKKISPTVAEIELSGATKASVVEIIEKAGYKVENK